MREYREKQDMGKIIKDATQYLNEAYQDGNEVYIFGFSRGAAIARRGCRQDKKTWSEG